MDTALKILLIGSGGREHALAWRLSKSPLVKHVYVAPGNGGTELEEKCTNTKVASDDFSKLVEFAQNHQVNLVVPGPEQPLVDGIEAMFRKVGIPVFGPSAQAARMEGSKAFSKEFMAKHIIPTARFRVFSKDQYSEACQYVQDCGHRVVLKASGLAAGKGVLIPQTTDDTLEGLRHILVDNVFGSAGNEVVIEEYLEGPELSVLAFSDGYTVYPLPAAQDHKRIGEGDIGPNTGGMGAYSPAPVATPVVMQRIMNQALQPTIDGMRRDGYPFVGLLFVGFILTESGPKVLEYNVRFGDPETEALMLLLDKNTDLAAIMLACVGHWLDAVNIGIREGFTVSIVLASRGYPGSYKKGEPITLGDDAQDVVVFHAGTSRLDGKVVTSGGRVIAVTAFAPTLREACTRAYTRIEGIIFEGKTYRRDIAHRALSGQNALPITRLTYAQAGVSVEAGNFFVETIKPFVRATRRPGSEGVIGGFGGVFDLKAAGYRDPVLVSGTDGVGTKLRIAFEAGMHDTVGIDLVAMSVNDLIVQGAEPLYFLDYYGCSKLDVSVASDVVRGIADGCIQAGCALIGGETAEMPGMYSGGDYDLAGFAVGAVERDQILPRGNITSGDFLLGIPSSGLHSNGFSLVRKIIEASHLSYTSPTPWAPEHPLGHTLLTPTKIYIKTLLPVVREGGIKALAHITGGGFIENIPRVLPKGLGAIIDAAAWPLPSVFRWLMRAGGLDALEMSRTFNCGIGMVLLVAPADVDFVVRGLAKHGEPGVLKIGEVTQGEGVEMRGMQSWRQ